MRSQKERNFIQKSRDVRDKLILNRLNKKIRDALVHLSIDEGVELTLE